MRPATRLALVSVAVLVESLTPVRTSDPLQFAQGVASGEVTPFSAVVWTRTDREARLTVELSDDPQFQGPTQRRLAFASSSRDFTARVLFAPLQPDHVYFYRWRGAGSTSETGSFKTAPSPFRPADVRFAYTGDSDGLFSVFGNTFAALDAVRAESPDFFIYLGDTIYADSSLRLPLLGLGPAVSLADYRGVYKLNREFSALRALMGATSTYAVWDDHEVRDNFAGQTVDPSLFANGRQAFLEHMPLLPLGLLDDSGCAARPLFRAFRWGRDVEIIILDERSCRSAAADGACFLAPGAPDLAPTLPPSVRSMFGGLVPPSPPPGCLEAIFDPARTMLGERQKVLLKTLLQRSTARFKFVINEVPMQQYYVLPYDRWEGYGAERREILDFVRAHDIRNVIFLTTDTHASLINQVFVDRFADPAPLATEVVTGPIATFTFQQEAEALAVRLGLPPAVVLGALNQLLTLVGVDCRNLNQNSYGLVEVRAEEQTTTLSIKDELGNPVTDSLSGLPCASTLGP